MEIFQMRGYEIHVTVKIPHLYENNPTFSYQFLIFDKEGNLMNYPFSCLIAYNDDDFRSELAKYFDKYLSYTRVEAYPRSKFLEMVANNV
ncbi:MAG: hypothetical protein ACFE9Z_12220 [Promethearchaeota archaeon]